MIHGIVTDNGVPTIEVEAGGERWDAIVDTGFNGDLQLAERLRPHVNAQFVGRANSVLAANQVIEEEVYLVDFPFDGRIVRAEATFAIGNVTLIGTRLLREYRLQVDFPTGTVEIEQVSRRRAR